MKYQGVDPKGNAMAAINIRCLENVDFKVPDVEDFAAFIMARGVNGFERPAITPWGTREMLLTDPDGNRLRFATDL